MPAICPNGIVGGSWYPYSNVSYGQPDSITAWYNTGYNPGACSGSTLNIWESNWDIGVPPDVNYGVCASQFGDLKV